MLAQNKPLPSRARAIVSCRRGPGTSRLQISAAQKRTIVAKNRPGLSFLPHEQSVMTQSAGTKTTGNAKLSKGKLPMATRRQTLSTNLIFRLTEVRPIVVGRNLTTVENNAKRTPIVYRLANETTLVRACVARVLGPAASGRLAAPVRQLRAGPQLRRRRCCARSCCHRPGSHRAR